MRANAEVMATFPLRDRNILTQAWTEVHMELLRNIDDWKTDNGKTEKHEN